MTYCTELHSSQFQETYSWHIMHEEIGLKFDPHPGHEPLLYILLEQVTYCIKVIVVYICSCIINTISKGFLRNSWRRYEEIKMSRLITDEGYRNYVLYIICSVLIGVILLLSLTVANSLFVSASKSFCYDQLGGGQHCFGTEKKCKQVQKHDEKRESPCYIDLVN